MNRLPSLDEYFAAAERGEVSALYSPDRKYVKFKYTAQAIYSSRWNRVTLHARGHVFNVSTGECVLRPWDKFFNYSELVLSDNSFTPIYHASAEEGMFFPQNNKSKTLQGELGHFIATDKLDGSLCIAGLVDGKPMVTSSGAIHSEHSEWSRKWLEGHDILGKLEPGLTYMFETIADSLIDESMRYFRHRITAAYAAKNYAAAPCGRRATGGNEAIYAALPAAFSLDDVYQLMAKEKADIKRNTASCQLKRWKQAGRVVRTKTGYAKC